MKNLIIFFVLYFIHFYTPVIGQVIQPNITGLDSVICIGQEVTITGSQFFNGLSTQIIDFVGFEVLIGGQICNKIDSISSFGDTVVVGIPPQFNLLVGNDTLQLEYRKKMLDTGGSSPVYFYDKDSAQIILSNPVDSAYYSVPYFCQSSPNPSPTIVDLSGFGGVFENSPSNLAINTTTGEINLLASASNQLHQFEYRTFHPACPDTIPLSITILSSQQSYTTYEGQTSISKCRIGTLGPDSLPLVHGVFHPNSSNSLIVDSTTGVIDLGQSQTGNYTINYYSNSGCSDTVSFNVNLLPNDTASISYQNTACQSVTQLQPTIVGNAPPGTYSSSPPGLAMGINGTIYPTPSIPAITYDISYSINEVCPNSFSVGQVTILPIDDASFTLAKDSVCQQDSILTLATVAQTGGTFYVKQNGNTFNISSGPIPVYPLLPPGLYELVHITNGACVDSDSITFVVNSTEDPSFDYLGFEICQSLDSIWPIGIMTGGGTFSSPTLGNALNSQNGVIDLNLADTINHQVTYITGGNCPSSSSDTIKIVSSPNPDFNYPGNNFCTSSNPILPILAGSVTGTFKADTNSYLSINPMTGEINPGQSEAGSHQITHSIPQCNVSTTVIIDISQTDSTISIQLPSDSICRDFMPYEPILLYDSSLGRPMGYWSLNGGGANLPPKDTLELHILPSDTNTLEYIVTGCGESQFKKFLVVDPHLVNLDYGRPSACQGTGSWNPETLNVIPFQKGYFSASSPNLIMDDSLGTIDTDNSTSGQYSITYRTEGYCPDTVITQLEIHRKPANFQLDILPNRNVCPGEEVQGISSGSNLDSLRFYLNGASLLNQDFFTVPFIPEDEDELLVWAKTINGCTDTLMATINVSPKPKIQTYVPNVLTIGSDSLILPLLNLESHTNVKWVLQIEDIQQDSGEIENLNEEEEFELVIPPSQHQAHSLASAELLVIPDALGCSGDTLKLPILLLPHPFSIYIPEVFTPNDDTYNDTWQIRWEEEINPDNYEIQVYNLSQGQVARITPLHQNWSGDNLPDGVYRWVLLNEVKEPVQKGGLTIRRK